jgi:hypothetical protein
MSDQEDSPRRNQLDEFIERVEKAIEEFPEVKKAGVQLAVPVRTQLYRESDFARRFETASPFALSEAAESAACNPPCPPGKKCFRFAGDGTPVCA